MKITKTQLKQIIKEELSQVLNEDEDKARKIVGSAIHKAGDLGFRTTWEPEDIKRLYRAFADMGVDEEEYKIDISGGKLEDERGLSQRPGVGITVDGIYYYFIDDLDRGLVDVG